MQIKLTLKLMVFSSLALTLINPLISYADIDQSTGNSNLVDNRAQNEKAVFNNPFSISFYKLNYILPFYYTEKVDDNVYRGNTPDNQSVDPYEINFQLSFKVPIWQNMMGSKSSLFAAYTQQSFWQAYNGSPFFRETDYEPEIFVANQLDLPFLSSWRWNFLNVGAVHQSNGEGGELERTWNRLYLEGILANNNWVVNIKPWLIIRDNSLENHNSDIGKYLGYGQVTVNYQFHQQVFSLEVRNMLESSFERGALTAGWSFPITSHINFYTQVFSGYGQSLIEYNHYTNSVGVGFSLNKLG